MEETKPQKAEPQRNTGDFFFDPNYSKVRAEIFGPELLFALENLLACKEGKGGTTADADQIARRVIALVRKAPTKTTT